MTEFRTWRSFRFFVLLSSICLQLITGLADDPADSKNAMKAEVRTSSSGSAGLRVVVICLVVVAVVAFSVFMFNLWQKKKREEQYARLLRLFEEDDELELELGLRD